MQQREEKKAIAQNVGGKKFTGEIVSPTNKVGHSKQGLFYRTLGSVVDRRKAQKLIHLLFSGWG